MGFIYTNIYNNKHDKSHKYAIVHKIVYIRMSNTGDQHPN